MPYGMSDADYAREVDRKRSAGISLTGSFDKAAYDRGKAQLSGSGTVSSPSTTTTRSTTSSTRSSSSSGSSGGSYTTTTPTGQTVTIPSLTQTQVQQIQSYLAGGGNPTTIFSGPGQLSSQVTGGQPVVQQQPMTQQQIDALIQAAIQSLQPQQPQIPEELSDLLNRLNQYQPPRTLSLEEARSRAESALKPLYDQQLQDTLKTVEQSLVQRGFFGQMPSVPITREEAARIENAKASAIANLANQLTGQSEESARAAENLAMQRAATEAGLYLNALQNAQAQQQQSFSNLATIINMLNSIRQQDREYGLQEAGLTGTYMGAPTLPAQIAALTQAFLPLLQTYGSSSLAGDLNTVLQYYYGR